MAQARERAVLAPRVAFMPQGLGRNLYPTLSVAENIDFFARLFGQGARERAARLQRLMDATGLSPFRDRPAGKLSGGMKQKLGLCCALVHDPDLLILDEPTTGVDPLSRRQFWALVEALRAERPGMSVIVATAYMEEAERFEHLVAMNGGRVLVFDRTREVLARTPQGTLEAAYIDLLPPEQRGNTAPLAIPPRLHSEGPPAIEATRLTRRFGDFVAVDGVSFRIERGEIFGFLGSNGCGKTTTMKMLTGLLDISSGEARLLGEPIRAGDLATRLRVGYMSQAFSLYEELSVRQNLGLHARLYRLDGPHATEAIDAALRDFDLQAHADASPKALSLGIRQRLQLAAACLHKPEVLILDEPTSGVDPAARDLFWRRLVTLSREQQVTIFVSTHFMNEAERRDRIRLTFALLGPIILLVTAAWSISFDVEHVKFAVLDHDQTHDSRQLIGHFAGSRYFEQQPDLHADDEVQTSLRRHDVSLVMEIPPGFGRDLLAGRRPEVGFFIDGTQPFTAENVRGYAQGIVLEHAMRFARETPGLTPPTLPARLEPRFAYNQSFRSIYASTPGLLMLCLIIIPTMLTALGVVREKEMGSILNLYASPATVGQFLLGKQMPYIALAMASYLTLVFLSVFLLQVPLKGSFLALSLGALCFVFATTALGLFLSAFLRSQVAASFASAIICLIPSVNFSGLLYPVSTLTGAAVWVGKGFPASWFQLISLGAFTKGLGMGSFWPMYAALLGFGLLYLGLARLLVRKQEG